MGEIIGGSWDNMGDAWADVKVDAWVPPGLLLGGVQE